MIPVIPRFITVAIVLALPLATFAVWRILGVSASPRVRAGLAAFLFGWLGLAFALAPSPASVAGRDPFSLTPLIPIFALGSFAVALAGVLLSPSVRRAVDAASLPGLVG